MVNVFEINDKSERKICLTKERWNHITSPISPHAYMSNFIEEIKETLIKPDKIINSVYNYKANYYRYYKQRKQ